MSLPERVMDGIVWVFRRSHPDRAEFIEAVRAYHVRIVKSDDRWHPDEQVIVSPRVTITYEHWEGDEQLDRTVTFDADDGHAFTAGELLWKLNEDAAPRLKEQDHVFFEGLQLSEDAKGPVYDMHLGS